jgi:phosphoesterase RecJ-like protein
MNDALNAEIRQLFASAQRIAIISHIRPDGDAIGAVLGLGLSLQAAGKNVEMVLEDGTPASFRHLPQAKKIQRRIKQPCDVIIIVDASDLPRVGNVLKGTQPDLNIDHHVTNLNYAKLNLVIPQAEATCSILTEYIPQWGLTITPEAAEALLTGIVADTLGFRTSNVRPQALTLAAQLMELGANLPDLYFRALVSRSYDSARYWGCGLSRLQRDGGLIWTSLTLEDRVTAAYNGNDDADLVNVLSAIDDAAIAVIFVEQKDGRVKVSWRSQPSWNVSAIALQFGGGGHAAASGADIIGKMAEVQEMVLQSTRQLLDKVPQNGDNNNGNGETY